MSFHSFPQEIAGMDFHSFPQEIAGVDFHSFPREIGRMWIASVSNSRYAGGAYFD